jgi:hypothetical protein
MLKINKYKNYYNVVLKLLTVSISLCKFAVVYVVYGVCTQTADIILSTSFVRFKFRFWGFRKGGCSPAVPSPFG